MKNKRELPGGLYKYFFLLFGFAYLSLACTDERLVYNPMDEALKALQAEWQWIKTESPRTQSEFTPTTEGYQESILFKANDTIEYYRNQELTHKYPYHLKYRIDNSLDANSDSTLVLVINNGAESFFSTENDTLVLNQAYLDGPVSYYQKKKSE